MVNTKCIGIQWGALVRSVVPEVKDVNGSADIGEEQDGKSISASCRDERGDRETGTIRDGSNRTRGNVGEAEAVDDGDNRTGVIPSQLKKLKNNKKRRVRKEGSTVWM